MARSRLTWRWLMRTQLPQSQFNTRYSQTRNCICVKQFSTINTLPGARNICTKGSCRYLARLLLDAIGYFVPSSCMLIQLVLSPGTTRIAVSFNNDADFLRVYLESFINLAKKGPQTRINTGRNTLCNITHKK